MANETSITLPKRAQDLTGRIFGRLTALEYAGRKGQQAIWHCECQCGQRQTFFATNLLRGLSQSCGCARTDNALHKGSSVKFKSEYFSYRNMIARCLDPKTDGYENYGGRGIKICDRWINGHNGISGFECFVSDMGQKSIPSLTIDRQDSNGDYSPENCRWATMVVQQNNRRNNRPLTVNGVTKNLSEWAKGIGISRPALKARLDRGWDPQIAVTKVKGPQ